MQYAVLLYADAGLDAGPGAPAWDDAVQPHMAFPAALAERGIEMVAGAGLNGVATATSLRRDNGKLLVTDGPFAETKEQLWGFYVLEANDLDAVIDVVSGFWEIDHGTVEIRPVIPAPA